jgi:hypothetical protein
VSRFWRELDEDRDLLDEERPLLDLLDEDPDLLDDERPLLDLPEERLLLDLDLEPWVAISPPGAVGAG